MEERLPDLGSAAGGMVRNESQTGGGIITGTQLTLSKEWVLPPRMKPGRKATNRPSSKRQEQNRQAQQTFRDRRAARIAELEEENDGLRAEIGELSSSVRQLTQKVTELARINQNLMLSTSFNANNSTQVATPSPSPPSASSSPSDLQDTHKRLLAEPSHKAKRQEIDFTTGRPRSVSSATDVVSAVPHLVDECGFCSRGGPCVCREDEIAVPIEPPIQEDRELRTQASYVPGTCLQCLGDPTGQVKNRCCYNHLKILSSCFAEAWLSAQTLINVKAT